MKLSDDAYEELTTLVTWMRANGVVHFDRVSSAPKGRVPQRLVLVLGPAPMKPGKEAKGEKPLVRPTTFVPKLKRDTDGEK